MSPCPAARRRPSPPAGVALAAIVAAATFTACVPRARPTYPQASYGPAVIDGRRVVVADARGHYAALMIEADWIVTADGACVRGGDVALVTAAGPVMLHRAEVCVTLAPFSLVGEADVPFPGLGYLAHLGLDGSAPHARVSLGLGSALGRLDVGGASMPLNPHQFYLAVDYTTGFEAQLGAVTLSTPGAAARVVVAPQEPLVYVGGSLTGIIDDAGLGFSSDGRLPLAPRRPLFDGARWRPQTFAGHILAHGTVPLGTLPLSVNGRVLLDVDADRDGRTIFDGDAGDLALAADGTLRVGYDRAGFGFSLVLAEASVAFDGARQLASFEAHGGGGLFAGTPLAFIDAGSESIVRGRFRGPDDFELTARFRRSKLAGVSVSDLEVTLSPRGIVARGTASLLGVGEVAVEGSVDARGAFHLRGRADLHVGELRIAGAEVVLGNRGSSIRGRVAFLGNKIDVRGTVNARGFSLSGAVNIDLVVFRGTLRLGVTNRGVEALAEGRACVGKACVPIAGMEIDRHGRVCPIFPVVGRQCIKLAA